MKPAFFLSKGVLLEDNLSDVRKYFFLISVPRWNERTRLDVH